MGRPWKVAVDAFLSSHLGIISTDRLLALGCPSRTLANLVSDGALITMLPGVFRSAQWPCNREQILAAVCARNLAAMIGFTTAGQEWSLRQMADPWIHVLVPHGSSPRMEGVVVHRCRRIDPVDVVHRPDGIRLTSPPRTLFDSADMIGKEATTSVLEQLLNEQRVTFGTVSDTVRRLYHPNRPGAATMFAVIQSRPAWRSALQSDLEVKVLQEIAAQGLLHRCPSFRCACQAASTTSTSTSPGRVRGSPSRSTIRHGTTAPPIPTPTRAAIASSLRSVGRRRGSPTSTYTAVCVRQSPMSASSSAVSPPTLPDARTSGWARHHATGSKNRARRRWLGATSRHRQRESRPTRADPDRAGLGYLAATAALAASISQDG